MTRSATHVYVVRFKGGHKIGSTNDMSARLRDLQHAGLGKVHMVRKWKVARARAVEYAAQALLREHRVRGMDWFAVAEAQAVEAVTAAIGLVKRGKHARPIHQIEKERRAERDAELRRTCEEMNKIMATLLAEEIEQALAQMQAPKF